jgi:hypothetical protein
VDDLYKGLERVVLDSVWLPAERGPNGVSVRSVADPAVETVEAPHEFVANAMRAYRNAHHGFASPTDRDRRPSRHLNLLDGNVPDSIAALPPLWLISCRADPQFVGWRPLPVNHFD